MTGWNWRMMASDLESGRLGAAVVTVPQVTRDLWHACDIGAQHHNAWPAAIVTYCPISGPKRYESFGRCCRCRRTTWADAQDSDPRGVLEEWAAHGLEPREYGISTPGAEYVAACAGCMESAGSAGECEALAYQRWGVAGAAPGTEPAAPAQPLHLGMDP